MEKEKEKDRVEIKLNSPTNTYYSGQRISGQICFFLTKKTKIRAIHLQVCAKGKCKWMDMFHKDIYGNRNPRHVFYTGKEEFLNDTVNVPYVPARGIELSPGELSMDFTYDLPKHLPSSFKGNYGSIKYKLKVFIRKPWAFDERYTIPLKVVRYVNSPPIRPQPQICQTTRNISVFASGPISLVAELPSGFVIQNKSVTLHVSVDNRSGVHVDKLRFTIVQRICYHSMKPLPNLKVDDMIVFTKETGGVEKKSERSFAHDLLIPTCPPTDATAILDFVYILNVEAILPAFYKNISVSLPIEVYTGDGNHAPCIPGEAFPVCNLSSFEGNTSTSSPSHSQMHNESESSSLYSTTSESSTTTLSPAPRSSEHGTLNRGTSRSSFRDSIAYPPVPGQMSEIHCEIPPETYPMLAELVNEIHAPPPMNNSYPPPNIRTLPHYLQSSVRYEVQARYPIHELPPSYEELFGTAPSSPPSAPTPEASV